MGGRLSGGWRPSRATHALTHPRTRLCPRPSAHPPIPTQVISKTRPDHAPDPSPSLPAPGPGPGRAGVVSSICALAPLPLLSPSPGGASSDCALLKLVCCGSLGRVGSTLSPRGSLSLLSPSPGGAVPIGRSPRCGDRSRSAAAEPWAKVVDGQREGDTAPWLLKPDASVRRDPRLCWRLVAGAGTGAGGTWGMAGCP